VLPSTAGLSFFGSALLQKPKTINELQSDLPDTLARLGGESLPKTSSFNAAAANPGAVVKKQ
jgi:hypothetical protein